MKTLAEHVLLKAMEHHIENDVPFYENIFRPHSEMNYKLFAEAKKLYKDGLYEASDWFEQDLLESDIGEFAEYEGDLVPLDYPLQEAEHNGEQVELNKPKRGGAKKFYVYVKDGDKVKKVQWGDTTGLKIKLDNPEARKSFAARHRCADQTDKTSAAYWACRTPMYAKSLGLSTGGNFFW